MVASLIVELAPEFHSRLRKARIAARLTQGELAEIIGISRNAVTRWEHPSGAKPTLGHLSLAAQSTGVSLEWLCTGRGRMQFGISDGPEEPGLLLRYCAQDETEERILLALRELSLSQTRAIEALVSSLASERVAARMASPERGQDSNGTA